MEKIFKNSEFQNLIRLPGKVRGVVFQTDAEYIRQSKGEEGLAAFKNGLKKLGYLVDYENIKGTDWYPLGLRVVSLLVAKELFNWTDKDIEDMGRAAPKYSFIVKMLLKYFLTIAMTYKESPKYWVKHYTVGKIETPGYDLKKKYFLICLKDFKTHPIMCTYLGGYFITLAQYLLREAKNYKVKETKCMFRGDKYHEFVVSWE